MSVCLYFCLYVCLCIYALLSLLIRLSVCLRICVYVFACLAVCACVCLLVCVYVCLCLFDGAHEDVTNMHTRYVMVVGSPYRICITCVCFESAHILAKRADKRTGGCMVFFFLWKSYVGLCGY